MLQVMGTLDDCAKITDRRTMGKYLYQLLFQKYKLYMLFSHGIAHRRI